MRISVEKTDSGHKTFLAHGGNAVRWRVLLDGVEVRHALTADEELGEVKMHVCAGDGMLETERNASGERVLKTCWRRGAVVVERQ